MWLIQGSWFQCNTVLDTEMVPIEGAVIVLKEVMLRSIFYGVLHPEPECCGDLFHPDEKRCLEPAHGWISDKSGDSYIFNVAISAEEISFTKIYQHQKDEIYYSFSRKIGGIWIGEYTGAKVGTGVVWAALTPIEPQFFEPKGFARLIGKSTLHEWPEHALLE